MMSWGTVVVVALAVGLLAGAYLLLVRSRLPWPAIFVAALTSSLCYAVGAGAREDSSGPNAAIVTGSVAGFLSVVAAVLALVPTRDRSRPAPRTALFLSTAGIVLGAIGLLVTQLSA